MSGWSEWFPIEATRRIFLHVVVVVEIGLALAITTVVFNYLVPQWKDVVEAVDGVGFVGLLIIVIIKLLLAFWHENGFLTFALA